MVSVPYGANFPATWHLDFATDKQSLMTYYQAEDYYLQEILFVQNPNIASTQSHQLGYYLLAPKVHPPEITHHWKSSWSNHHY
ncbi:hypothetical protein VIGAN_03073500 [Vigna angularis var. angularis]|uniref:Uncharacterized protein n=1 Tax=Vigna angularis var. angularis TaxID=157739 RepID=A0A0S3RKK6_PHAAN|nr:hypothetical protein VIGAN_03073500 [Vigna angularis var. angularis]